MVDTKQTKTIGEHHVAAELARRGWAPAMTRDGLERTDILAVHTDGPDRRMVEIQVKGRPWEEVGFDQLATRVEDAWAQLPRTRVLRHGRHP